MPFCEQLSAEQQRRGKSSRTTRGNLDAKQLCVGKPGLEKALNEGLMWTVIHHSVGKAVPELLDLAQAALNARPKTDVTEIEVMLTLHEAAKAYIAKGENVDWQKCCAIAGRSKPPCASYIKAIADFCAKASGGADGQLLKEIAAFKNTFATAGVSLGGDFFRKVADMSWGGWQQFPHLRTAVVKANLASPLSKIEGGLCRLLSPSDANKLTSKVVSPKCVRAESLMSKAREALMSVPAKEIDDFVRVKVLGSLDCRCVYFILNKGKASLEAKEYKSFEEIGKAPEHVCVVCFKFSRRPTYKRYSACCFLWRWVATACLDVGCSRMHSCSSSNISSSSSSRSSSSSS